ncbi:hypothetical protein NCLIV_057480 [Neospora caninum Liverpool]|uniref:Uncharacterized protein n=1 Tax=Neospora caninum (strain Liverpool) TaxID=572307 RepID=F0VNM9_NEOCL|nr:hypothetical protein NCLIV_057480 [Neospora caninum Liverpool]CBZ55325.1 hypothetical protein NCLIV_057480 [Neospora caninum Liverpool]CEL70056.1 TPA: hypothetical protein BN1204_057480 [Neospora caninum Liverpool]|eukprot:XP_003885353.1 hypothetical protein NCLIV_057480 [Neospora caninum Liverpool]
MTASSLCLRSSGSSSSVLSSDSPSSVLSSDSLSSLYCSSPKLRFPRSVTRQVSRLHASDLSPHNATPSNPSVRGKQRSCIRRACLVSLVCLVHASLCVSGAGEAAVTTGGLCRDHFPNDPVVLNYCQNGATWKLLQIICNCAELQTTEYLYAGPSCSIKQKLAFVAGSFGTSVRNTCWLENLLGLNSWKDVPSRVASFCYTLPCPSPDGSSI